MSNNSTNQQTAIPIFSGYNYDQWVVKMRTLLIGYGLCKYLDFAYEECNGKIEMENDKKALSFIQQGLSPEIFPKIMHATKAKEAWDILKMEFEGNSSKAPPCNSRRSNPMAPMGSKREKALMAITTVAQTMSIARCIYTGIHKLSHHKSSENGDGFTTESDDGPYFDDGDSENHMEAIVDGIKELFHSLVD